jgi:hypothetical protein
MIPDEYGDEDLSDDGMWARVRHWVVLVAKAAVAIAAISGVAHWVSRTTLDRATLSQLAAGRNLDPQVTGSLVRPPRRPSAQTLRAETSRWR